jgi:protein O-mannosyl-transferase
MTKFRWWIPLSLATLCAVAYNNTLHAPFIFDDILSIVGNPAIRRLWPLLDAMTATFPGLLGRPLASLSLAINYACGGYNVMGYHLFNLTLHILNAVLVFGVARHALVNARTADVRPEETMWLAYAVAALWMLHPLLTESVTYVLQRTELLMALFLLLTLYCFIRGIDSAHRTVWFGLSVIACILGMGAKEVMVVTPLLVLAYDYVFVASSLRDAWRSRERLYVGLAASWVVLAALQLTINLRSKSGLGVASMGCWEYLVMQCSVLVHYLRLVVWPRGLVLDYSDWPRTSPLAAWLPRAGLLLMLLAATVWAMRRRLWWGFWGAWFFLLLAPSSSFLPLPTEPAAERRMYLPLLAVIAVALGGGRQLCRGVWNRFGWPDRARVRLQTGVVIGLTAALGITTFQRNAQYRTASSIWADVVAKRPGSARGHANLALAMLEEGKAAESIPHFLDALRLDPNQATIHCNLGDALVTSGATNKGIAEFEEALRLDPNYVPARVALGNAMTKRSDVKAALELYQAAVASDPDDEGAHFNLAELLARMGRRDEAAAHYLETLRINPNNSIAHYNLANLLAESGHETEAVSHYTAAARLNPRDARFPINLGNLLLRQGRQDAAIAAYTEALRADPTAFEAHNNLAIVLASRGNLPAATEHFREAARIRPNLPEVHAALAQVLDQQGLHDEAQRESAEASRLSQPASSN